MLLGRGQAFVRQRTRVPQVVGGRCHGRHTGRGWPGRATGSGLGVGGVVGKDTAVRGKRGSARGFADRIGRRVASRTGSRDVT